MRDRSIWEPEAQGVEQILTNGFATQRDLFKLERVAMRAELQQEVPPERWRGADVVNVMIECGLDQIVHGTGAASDQPVTIRQHGEQHLQSRKARRMIRHQPDGPAIPVAATPYPAKQ